MATVAVIEQEHDIRMLLGDILNRCGFKTLLFPRIENSQQELRKQNVDLVVADLDTARTIDPEISAPFVMIASYLPEGREKEIMKSGARSVLKKPFSIQELMDIVRRCIAEN